VAEHRDRGREDRDERDQGDPDQTQLGDGNQEARDDEGHQGQLDPASSLPELEDSRNA
jgi:hypothetical protein